MCQTRQTAIHGPELDGLDPTSQTSTRLDPESDLHRARRGARPEMRGGVSFSERISRSSWRSTSTNFRLAMSANALRAVTIADKPTLGFKCSTSRDSGSYIRRAAVAFVSDNNAEHAIKAFARLRSSIEGLSTPKGIEEYLILLSVCQTCKYSGLDFLGFLRSGETDIGTFVASQRNRSRVHC